MTPFQFIRTPEQLNSMAPNTLLEALGIEFTYMDEHCLKATMPVDQRTHQPFGLLHGGASAALSESLGSTASHLCIDPQTHFSVGLELNANHIRAKTEGIVTGVTTPIHIGRSTHIWDIRITDEVGKLVCISRLTTMIRART